MSVTKQPQGQRTLSAEAIRSRANRIFSKRADGSKKVSDEIWNDWKSKGPKNNSFKTYSVCVDMIQRLGLFLYRLFFR